jgi:hypothetical protein
MRKRRETYQVDSSHTGFKSLRMTRVEYIGLPYLENANVTYASELPDRSWADRPVAL